MIPSQLITDWASLMELDMGNEVVRAITTGFHVVIGLFQACVTVAAYFAALPSSTIQARNLVHVCGAAEVRSTVTFIAFERLILMRSNDLLILRCIF